MFKKKVYGKSRKGTNKKSSNKNNQNSNQKSSQKFSQTSNQTSSQVSAQKDNEVVTIKPIDLSKSGPVHFYIQDATKVAPSPGSPYSLPGVNCSPFFPLSTPGSPECIFFQVVKFLESAQKAAMDRQPDGQEIIFGVRVPYPGYLDKLTSFEDKMKLLEAWDRQNQAELIWMWPDQHSLAEHFGVKSPSKLLADTMNEFAALAEQLYRKAGARDTSEEAKNAPTEQELVEAYELWQYEQRKALGEPVLFRDGHLRFEKILADNNILPGPFPGLDLYSQFGRCLEPKAFAEWLESKQPQRETQKRKGVGFFGCVNCPLWAADMVRYCSYAHRVCGSESYRAFIWGNGKPDYNLVVASTHAQNALESGKPLPCMMQD